MQGEEKLSQACFNSLLVIFLHFCNMPLGVFLCFLSTALRAHAVTHKHTHIHTYAHTQHACPSYIPFNLATRINRQTGRVFIYQLMSQSLNLFATLLPKNEDCWRFFFSRKSAFYWRVGNIAYPEVMPGVGGFNYTV